MGVAHVLDYEASTWPISFPELTTAVVTHADHLPRVCTVAGRRICPFPWGAPPGSRRMVSRIFATLRTEGAAQ